MGAGKISLFHSHFLSLVYAKFYFDVMLIEIHLKTYACDGDLY